MKIDVGHLIEKKLQERERSTSWLAGKVAHSRSSLYKILKQTEMSTDLLMRISIALDYDFFHHYSVSLQNINETKKEREDTDNQFI